MVIEYEPKRPRNKVLDYTAVIASAVMVCSVLYVAGQYAANSAKLNHLHVKLDAAIETCSSIKELDDLALEADELFKALGLRGTAHE